MRRQLQTERHLCAFPRNIFLKTETRQMIMAMPDCPMVSQLPRGSIEMRDEDEAGGGRREAAGAGACGRPGVHWQHSPSQALQVGSPN